MEGITVASTDTDTHMVRVVTDTDHHSKMSRLTAQSQLSQTKVPGFHLPRLPSFHVLGRKTDGDRKWRLAAHHHRNENRSFGTQDCGSRRCRAGSALCQPADAGTSVKDPLSLGTTAPLLKHPHQNLQSSSKGKQVHLFSSLSPVCVGSLT